MLVFQAVLTRGQPRMCQTSVPVAGDAVTETSHCSECDKRFSTKTGFRRHMAIHGGHYPYHCQYCGRGFAATNNLKGHLAKHTGIKAFVCHICKKEFSYGNVLKAHVKKYHADSVP